MCHSFLRAPTCLDDHASIFNRFSTPIGELTKCLSVFRSNSKATADTLRTMNLSLMDLSLLIAYATPPLYKVVLLGNDKLIELLSPSRATIIEPQILLDSQTDILKVPLFRLSYNSPR